MASGCKDQSSGQKFVLKPGELVRLGRAPSNEVRKSTVGSRLLCEVVLDYEGVSKHHVRHTAQMPSEAAAEAEILLREKLPEEEGAMN